MVRSSVSKRLRVTRAENLTAKPTSLTNASCTSNSNKSSPSFQFKFPRWLKLPWFSDSLSDSKESKSTSPLLITMPNAFKLLLSVRIAAALFSPISDCDETYNYWEPTHFLLYGYGYQTWEYSPLYAIRSYAYIYVHQALIFTLARIGLSKLLLFYMLRCGLGSLCAVAEVYFYSAVSTRVNSNTGFLTLWFLAFSSGLFLGSVAYLPSTTAMYCVLIAFGAWFENRHRIAIAAIAFASIVAWPFAALLGVPIAIHLVIEERRLFAFLKWSIIAGVVIGAPVYFIDTNLYGRRVFAPLNILMYNVFGGGGPELYGVEPLSYYVKNLVLNFNLAAPLAMVAPLFVLASHHFVPSAPGSAKLQYPLLALALWLMVFFSQPHKEERFLYPIYPLLAFAAAVTLDHAQKLLSFFVIKSQQQRGDDHYSSRTLKISYSLCFVYFVFSVSRCFSVYFNYSASLDIYVELHKKANDGSIAGLDKLTEVNLCIAKEWYRFPSHFLLPNSRFKLRFLKSAFKGQLPKLYASGPNATMGIPTEMNDLNLEEPSRYIELAKCHFIVDHDVESRHEDEPQYSSFPGWSTLHKLPYLVSSRSHQFLRAFYVPFVSSRYCVFADYVVLQNDAAFPKRSSV